MAKRKISKKYNTPIYLYVDGGILQNKISSVSGAVSSIFGAGQANAKIADTSELENSIDQANAYKVQATDNDSLMNEWGTFSPLQDINWRDIRGSSSGDQTKNTLGAAGSGAAAGAAIGGVPGAIIGGVVGLIGGLFGKGKGDRKAKRKAAELNREIDQANNHSLLSLQNAASNIEAQNDYTTLANFAAKGGKIYIKPENRGKFTDYCGGKVTSECIARGKRSSSPTIRKRATFAANARKWHHSLGGHLFDNGGNTNTEEPSSRRVDFSTYKPIYNRGFIPENMEQLQDSLIARGFNEPQRLAILSNILHESGGDPKAVDKGGDFSGLAQWGKGRHPNTEDLGEQIHHLMVESTTPKAPAWSDGGDGLPYIRTLKEGYNSFWNAEDPYNAALYYSKGLIRPKEHTARFNRAREAQNMMKYLKAEGGFINNQHGGVFSNDVTIIGNGGTHENNPFEGVQIGVDSQGIPNLVEEGEVIWNDYVFSNRLKVPKEFKDKYKVKGETFADVAKKLQKESEERPNDPISKRGLEDSMVKLQMAQEDIRIKNEMKNSKNKFAKGGKMGVLFEGPGDRPNSLPLLISPGTNIKIGTAPTIQRLELLKKMQDRIANLRPNKRKFNVEDLRYAPIVGSAIGVADSLFSRPDYSNADLILDAARKAGEYTPIEYDPIGNYLTYNPLDRDYYINKLNAQSGATRRAIINQSAGNRATAVAGLLAADYNAQGQLGDLARKAEEYNLAQRQAVEQFNRGTNMANAEMALQTARANQVVRAAANEAILKGTAQAASMKEGIDQQLAASRNANLTNLFNNLGNVGIDAINRADRDMLIRSGAYGTLSEKPYGWSDARWDAYQSALTGKGFAKGGKLKKKCKCKKGLTY